MSFTISKMEDSDKSTKSELDHEYEDNKTSYPGKAHCQNEAGTFAHEQILKKRKLEEEAPNPTKGSKREHWNEEEDNQTIVNEDDYHPTSLVHSQAQVHFMETNMGKYFRGTINSLEQQPYHIFNSHKGNMKTIVVHSTMQQSWVENLEKCLIVVFV